MNLNMEEVKSKLLEATKMFFENVPVIWAEQIATKPKLPYVTLDIGDEQRNSFPSEDENCTRFYMCSSTLDINLYTQGKKVSDEKNVTVNYKNTSVSDLSDFVNFIESDVMTDFFYCCDMSLMLKPPIRDLSTLENDTKYRYRAMAEFEVSYMLEVDGAYGTMKMADVTNSSGGGTEKLRVAQEFIEDIEISMNGGN